MFGELKNARGMSRARLRGLNNVQTEALMAATAHNVLKMARRFMRFAREVEAQTSDLLLSVAIHLYSNLRPILVAA